MGKAPLRILLAPDKFKGSLLATEVIGAIQKGILHVFPETEIHTLLASDGGDGFLNSVAQQIVCQEILLETMDPLGRKVYAPYLWDAKKKAAYIEMACASGLHLLTNSEKHALQTHTTGTGLLIKDAMGRGAKTIFIGLGGSATNDAGIGIATALGYQFLDRTGRALSPSGGNLLQINSIAVPESIADLEKISCYAVHDVDNPLYGKQGAAYMYAAQKGADKKEIEKLDQGLRHLDILVKQQMGKNLAEVPGAGAAGGCAYGLMAFCDAKLITGTRFIFDLAQVENLLMEHQFDYIITGEGKIDRQTLHGKLIHGVTELGRKFNVRVVAIGGQIDLDKKELKTLGLYQAIEVKNPSKSLQYNMEHGAELIENAIIQFLDGQ